MTDIRNMPAGREMDALVAEKVMGLVECDKWRIQRWHPIEYIKDKDDCEHEACRPVGFAPRYSTDIAAAWGVVEYLLEKGWHLKLDMLNGWCDATAIARRADDYIVTRLDVEHYRVVLANTVQLAICRVALLAVEGG